MPVFVLPTRWTSGINSRDTEAIKVAVAKAVANVGSDVFELLQQVPDAHRFLTSEATPHQQLWALKRLELCELELARRCAVMSPDYFGDNGSALSLRLDDDVARAMEKSIALDEINRDHTRLVVRGLRELSYHERQQRYTEKPSGDYDRAFPPTAQPSSNRSKGGKHRRRTGNRRQHAA